MSEPDGITRIFEYYTIDLYPRYHENTAWNTVTATPSQRTAFEYETKQPGGVGRDGSTRVVVRSTLSTKERSVEYVCVNKDTSHNVHF